MTVYVTEVLHGVQGEKNSLHTIKRRKINCVGNILGRKLVMRDRWDGKTRRKK